MKYSSVTLACCLFVFSGTYSAAEEKLRVLDKGLDGSHRTFLITCPDGGYSSVVQKFNLADKEPETLPDHDLRLTRGNTAVEPQVEEVCIHPRQGDDICRPSWDIEDAARASCQ